MARRLFIASICAVISISIACGGKIVEDPLGSTRDVGNGGSDDGASTARPVPTSSSSSTSGSSTPTKSATLEPRAPGAGGAYPYCEAIVPDGWKTYCSPTLGGHGYYVWHADGTSTRWCDDDVSGNVMTDCNACQCRVGCSEASPCPAAPSGTSTPQCIGLTTSQSTGICILPCGGGERCPDGMTCVDSPEMKWKSCAWVR